MEPKKQPRSKQKIMLPETIAIRKMREVLRLDRKTGALLLEKSPKQLEKIENGYVEITPQLILHFLLYESKLILNKLIHCLPREVFEVQRLASPPIQVRFSIEAETPIGSFLR